MVKYIVFGGNIDLYHANDCTIDKVIVKGRIKVLLLVMKSSY